jgi:hypothetical protein
MTPRERFLTLLNNILRLDLAELNLGIYRILNARRDLVLKFLAQKLPDTIARQFISAPQFDAIASRRPGETRKSLDTRGILIQGEDAADIQAIFYDLKTLT